MHFLHSEKCTNRFVIFASSSVYIQHNKHFGVHCSHVQLSHTHTLLDLCTAQLVRYLFGVKSVQMFEFYQNMIRRRTNYSIYTGRACIRICARLQNSEGARRYTYRSDRGVVYDNDIEGSLVYMYRYVYVVLYV
jgi:hypothetical protein